MLNRFGSGISCALLCAALVASPALAEETSKTAGNSTTLSAMTSQMSPEAGTDSLDEEPAHSTGAAGKAASRAAGVLQQYEPKTTGRITSLSTLDRSGKTPTASGAQVAGGGNSARGYNAWRNTSSVSKSQVAASKKALPQHAPPKRSSDDNRTRGNNISLNRWGNACKVRAYSRVSSGRIRTPS